MATGGLELVPEQSHLIIVLLNIVYAVCWLLLRSKSYTFPLEGLIDRLQSLCDSHLLSDISHQPSAISHLTAIE